MHPPRLRRALAEYPGHVIRHLHARAAELRAGEGLIPAHEEIDIEATLREKQQCISKAGHGSDRAHGEEHRDAVSRAR